MSDHYLDNLLPDFGEYSLDSILDSYRNRAAARPADGDPSPAQPAKVAEAIAQRSRQIVMEALGETISQRGGSSVLDFDARGLGELLEDDDESAPAPAEEAKTAPAPEPEQPKKPRVHISPAGEMCTRGFLGCSGSGAGAVLASSAGAGADSSSSSRSSPRPLASKSRTEEPPRWLMVSPRASMTICRDRWAMASATFAG